MSKLIIPLAIIAVVAISISVIFIFQLRAGKEITWQMKGVAIDVSLEEMKEMRSAGIMVLTTEWGMEEDVVLARAFLDRAHAAGLKVVMDGGFSEAAWGHDYDKGFSKDQLPVWQEALVKEWVYTFKDHPALFGWDISNEDGENFSTGAGSPLWPEKSSLTIEQLKRVNGTIRTADPKHPILLRMHYWDPSPNPFGSGNWFADGIADIVMLNLYSNFSENRKTPNLPDMIAEHGQRHIDDVHRVDPDAKIWIALAAFEAETHAGYFLRPTASDLRQDIKTSRALSELSGIGFLEWGPQKYAKPLWYLPRDGGDLWQVIREEISASQEGKTLRSFDKFALWQRPSFFRGAALHPYAPYGLEEGRVDITKQDTVELRTKGANVVSLNYPGPFTPDSPYELDEEAFAYLDKAVNWAAEAGLYVIIHFRNGPGKSEETFYSEDEKKDETLWYSEEAKAKWIEMWQFVANKYKNKPHVIAYNLMVEPHPEDPVQQEPRTADVWFELAKRITTAIREEDKDTPIIVGATAWSNPLAFSDLKLTGDSRTIYSFHMYEPIEFTHQGFDWAGRGNVPLLTYPGMIPSDVYEVTKYWNQARIEEFLEPVLKFQRENDVPIHVGEFGCNRKIPSCVNYLEDLLSIFEKHNWSYTYYVWRVDDGFDYEEKATGDTRATESEYMKLFKKHWSKNEYLR